MAKKMRIASILQIILGVSSALFTYFLISKGDVTAANVSSEKALGILALSYGFAGFQVFAGIVGLIRAGKKSLFSFILGILLFVPALWNFFNFQGQILLIAVNAISLVFPYFYMHTAYKTFKGSK